MRKEYIVPEMEIVAFTLNGVCSDVIHTSFEQGGGNTGWTWNDNDDEDFGELP